MSLIEVKDLNFYLGIGDKTGYLQEKKKQFLHSNRLFEEEVREKNILNVKEFSGKRFF